MSVIRYANGALLHFHVQDEAGRLCLFYEVDGVLYASREDQSNA